MNARLEAAARALCEFDGFVWDHIGATDAQGYREQAAAVLAAADAHDTRQFAVFDADGEHYGIESQATAAAYLSEWNAEPDAEHGPFCMKSRRVGAWEPYETNE